MPNTCNLCYKTYSTKTNLNRHVRKHFKNVINKIQSDDFDDSQETINLIINKEFKVAIDSQEDDEGDYDPDEITDSLRSAVWTVFANKYLVHGKCLCCGTEDINTDNFHCKHVISIPNNGLTSIHNLRPVCANCDRLIGTTNMAVFMRDSGYDVSKLLITEQHLQDIQTLRGYMLF